MACGDLKVTTVWFMTPNSGQSLRVCQKKFWVKHNLFVLLAAVGESSFTLVQIIIIKIVHFNSMNHVHVLLIDSVVVKDNYQWNCRRWTVIFRCFGIFLEAKISISKDLRCTPSSNNTTPQKETSFFPLPLINESIYIVTWYQQIRGCYVHLAVFCCV